VKVKYLEQENNRLNEVNRRKRTQN